MAKLDMTKWMSSVDGTRRLSALTIPGTHDTCTASYKGGAIAGVRTQDRSVLGQLRAGIRFLDIRCRHVDDRFALVHNKYYLNQHFGKGVQDVCLDFLAEHPSETILVSTKEGDHVRNSESFEATFDRYVRDAGSAARWYFGTTIPTLDDVRGKLVLFRRFAAGTPKGLDASAWKSNATFSIDGPAKLRIQDRYKVVSPAEKFAIVKKFLDETAAGEPDRLYVDLCSAAGIPVPKAYAAVVNPLLGAYLSEHGRARLGVVVMDFQTESLNQQLAGMNLAS